MLSVAQRHHWLLEFSMPPVARKDYEECYRNSPLEEVRVLGLSDEPSPHHDGLEALALDGPEAAVRRGFDGGGSLAVVQYGELAEHLAWSHCAEVLVLPGHLHSALC